MSIAQTNFIQANQASGSKILQAQSAKVATVAIGGGWHGMRDDGSDAVAQSNVIQANQASGREILQLQKADVATVAVADGAGKAHFHKMEMCFNDGEYGKQFDGGHAIRHDGADAVAQTNLIQANQASGREILQLQKAKVATVAVAHGGHSMHDGGADAVAQTNLIQANQASGREILQLQKAKVATVAVAHGGHSMQDGGADAVAQSNVIQANQASGTKIAQFEAAKVATVAVGEHGGDMLKWTIEKPESDGCLPMDGGVHALHQTPMHDTTPFHMGGHGHEYSNDALGGYNMWGQDWHSMSYDMGNHSGMTGGGSDWHSVCTTMVHDGTSGVVTTHTSDPTGTTVTTTPM